MVYVTSAEGMVTLRCIPVDQPIGMFYIGAMEAMRPRRDFMGRRPSDRSRVKEQPSAVIRRWRLSENHRGGSMHRGSFRLEIEPSDEVSVIRYRRPGIRTILGHPA